MLTSWKTTIAGLAAALGLAAQKLDGPQWLRIVGMTVGVLGLMAFGMFAQDAHPTPMLPAAPPPPPPGPVISTKLVLDGEAMAKMLVDAQRNAPTDPPPAD